MSSQENLNADQSVQQYVPSPNGAGAENPKETPSSIVIKLSDLASSDADPTAGAPSDMPVFVAEGVPEIGGRREGLEPTRYGDWEKKGRCIDF